MFPVIFQLGDTALYTYTTLYSLAIVIGGAYWVMLVHKHFQTKVDIAINSLVIMIVFGLLGAKALFVLTNWSKYQNGSFEIWNPASGGVVFYGGALLGAFSLAIWCKKNKIKVIEAFNLAAAPLCIGHIIGRLGCLAHGCCHGKLCSISWLGTTYSDIRSVARPLNAPMYPTQLFEIVGLIFLFLILKAEIKKNGSRGNSFKKYLIGYGTLRFFVEFFRGDSLRGAAYGLSTSQIISILLIILALFLDLRRDKYHNSPHENRS